MVKICAAQMQVAENREENYQKSLRFIREAAAAGAKMICFPEGQLTRYIPQYPGLNPESFSLPENHPYIEGFKTCCRENAIIACISLNLSIGGNIYPSMMLIDERGEILGITKKHHIVYAPHFYERDYFTPGDEGFPVFETSIGRIGQIVCFDRHFPESFRTLALKGADFIITAVANEKAEPTEIFRWEIRISAFQNSVHCLMVNRVGLEGNMDFCGETLFAGPDGSVIAQADDTEQLLFAEPDFLQAKKIREEKQYLSLRRSDIFELD